MFKPSRLAGLIIGKPIVFLTGIVFASVLIASSAVLIVTGDLGVRFPDPYPPIFYFSPLIYSLQGLLALKIFVPLIRDQWKVLGYVACSLLASYSAYEVLFKLSFPLLESERLAYLITIDLYPLIILSTSFLTLFVTKDSWSLRGKLFVGNLTVTVLLWILWWGTSFPVKIWLYEEAPTILPLFFNLLTKLSTSMLFVTIFKR